MAYPGKDGLITLKIPQNQRLEISLEDNRTPSLLTSHQISVYHLVNNELRKPPTGLSINYKEGTINWMPGPAYRGHYQLAIFIKGSNDQICKKQINIEIDY